MYQGGKPLEEKSKQSSSNYGSLSHAQGSSSSLSFSLGSMDDQPSTSGCSSDMAYGLRNNQVKKQKVKQYLRTLMSMVGPTSGRKMSTLSTLQHVVDSVRKITDRKNAPASQMCEMKNGNLPATEMDSKLLVKSSYDLTILVSMKKHVVHQVTPELMLLLEYPLDFWKGRIITDFMYKRDLLTFNSNIVVDCDLDDIPPPDVSKDDPDGGMDAAVKTFYIRFRSFKSIGKGYNLKRTAFYKPFQVNLRMVTAEQSGIETAPKHRKFMMLKCLPLESPYKENGELPEIRTFTMRHTMLSTVSHIHSNAIPLLGYLPQDIIGVSIFEIFHPDDLPVLHNVYKQVIDSKGHSIKQSRTRMKARNGEWIVVETEWSSFIDPWTKKLEFIMGQHTVINGPRDINVFEENLAGNRFSSEQLLEAQKYQQFIRKLLNSDQLASDKAEARQEARRETNTAVDRHVGREKNFLVPDEETVRNRDTREECRPDDAEEESMFYNQLNYSQNIKRYLMSQCIPGNVQFSQTSASLPQSTDEGDAATAAATIEPTDFSVNIQFTKPPSYGSSTIVHVSEHREDTIPSPPQPPEIVEDPSSQIRTPNIMFGTIPLPPQVELTQEALRKHTKLQERLLVQQAKQEDQILFLEKQKDNAGIKKRSLSDSGCQVNVNERTRPKMSKIDRGKLLESPPVSGEVFSTPFGIPMVPISTGNMMPPNLPPSKSHPMFTQAPPPEFLSMQNIPMYMQQFPVMQVDPTTGLATPVMTVYSNTTPLEPGLKSQGIQWPYFQQTGVSFVPQVMDGFYQTLTGMFQPFPLPRMNVEMSESKCPTSVPITSTITTTTPTNQQGGTPGAAPDSSVPMESSRLDSSTGNDTDSSLMYILEASSSINNSSKEDAMEKVKHVPPRKSKSNWFNPPAWLAGGKWTNDVRMQYQLPQRKLKNVLKADREALNKMDCGHTMVRDQLRELLDLVSQHDKVMDEEADYLMFEDVNGEDDNASLASESSSCCSDHPDLQQSGQVGSCRKSTWRRRRSTLTATMEEKQPDIEEVYRRWQEERGCDVLTSTQDDKDSLCSDDDRTDLKGKLGENDSNASNVSKDTSDITPSDQRSSEEAGSSLKESSDQKDSSAESETELRTECALVDSLFVKLPRNMKSQQHMNKQLALPFWLQEAEHTEDIAKKYQLSHMDIEDILSADRRALACLSQPSMVIEQCKQLNQGKDSEVVSSVKCPTDKSTPVTSEEGKQEPSFMIDMNVFENLFMPTCVGDSDKYLAGESQADELSGEELMMLD